MKKWLAVILMLTMVVLTACGSGDKGSSKDTSTVEQVKEKKKLVIGTNAGYYPFEMIDKKGEMVGYDMDVAKAFAKTLGAEVEVKQYGFDSLIAALQAGKVDAVFAGMTITPERENAVDFGESYYKTGQSVMVKADSDAKTIEDIDKKGVKIAVQIGTTGSIVAKKVIKNAEVKEFDDFPTAAIASQQGQVDAVIYDEPAIKVYALQNEGKVKALKDLLATDSLGIAIKKDDKKMLDALNKFLKEYIGSDEEIATKKKWFEDSDWLKTVKKPE
ncbi:basic amino acid ABC transporter substrate-binding protein [Kurthia sibirica]|uniref:Basic amino acid ABC transporter substrate-binding protein n=1 Tax=Kurthia sibirica TaxID=202750 RepID=A0A2U3AL06_9BACL|nr:basic amino acid ABC transporter substrate-binding protein [Kurthia sibirica]PWI25199.1 basic amino acid ABC transporter substrate-binding protein [Kurthia sibirica]GEK33289.1 amino acid ABC transporter substrate-binding protein [Kurthia sibirica]